MDDSGNPHPKGPGDFFVLAIAIFPMDELRDFNQTWARLVADHIGCTLNEAYVTEIHCSHVYEHYGRIRRGAEPLPDQPFSHLSETETANLIQSVWTLLSRGEYRRILTHPPALLGIVIHKESNWRRFARNAFTRWTLRTPLGLSKQDIRSLEDQLVNHIIENAFGYITQRLEYFLEEPEVDGIAVYIGDECAANKKMYQVQGLYTSGRGHFTQLHRIGNNIAFGSSNFNPGLQAADWTAYALSGWARRVPWLSDRLQELLPQFRGYPSSVRGRGIVLRPDTFTWHDFI